MAWLSQVCAAQDGRPVVVLSVFAAILSGCVPYEGGMRSRRGHTAVAEPVRAVVQDANAEAASTDGTADATTTPVMDSASPLFDATDGIVELDAASDEPLVQGLAVSVFFQQSCASCHGQHREGGLGPSLIPSRLDKPKSFYIDTVTQGRSGTLMRAWGLQLSEQDIANLVDFIFTEPDSGSIVWDIDEITHNHQVLVQGSAITDVPTHSGNLDNLMLITERESSSFAVVDGDTHDVLGHVKTGYRAHGYAFDSTNNRYVYCLGRDGWLYKIDLYALRPVIAVRVGVDSRGLAISDDGKFIIAGNYLPCTAVILDTETLMPLRVLYAHGEDPDGNEVDARVAIVSDVAPSLVGPYFIIALKEAGQVWRIDYSKPDFPVDVVRNVGHVLHDGFLSPDNQRFFIASQGDNWMAVIDVASWKLIDLIPTGDTPHPGSGATWKVGDIDYAATVHAGEGKVSIWNIGTGNLTAKISTSGPGLFIRSNEKSPYIWADAMFADPPHEITVFDGQSPDFPVLARITDGTHTLHPEFTKDAAFVYVADWEENVVRVYDAHYDSQSASFPWVKTIEGIAAPTGIFSVQRRYETLGH